MNRRSLLCSLLLAAPLLVGCENLSFLPQARRQEVTGYDAVKNGMTEAQVKRQLGEPDQRRGFQLEGTKRVATSLTYVGGGKLITIVLSEGKVIGKQRY